MMHAAAPFGIGHVKPRHFRDMLRVLWANRDNLRYAWRVLTRGVCDGCALGTTGLKDWTIEGTHLCMVRLELLRLNTMGALDHSRLADAAQLRASSSKELRALGRLAWPMRRRAGEKGFTRATFEEAFREIGPRWRAAPPDRVAMYLTSRGLTNEVYYVAQKVMRFLGSNNVDNSARLCHSPSTAGLKSTIGVAATTCSYTDWFDSDLIVFLGSNPANDQPVAMKYLARAKKRGARVVVVNAYREPGMERYWVPSDPDSALFGTKMADRFVMVKVGGDLALLNAVARRLIERGEVKKDFIEQATTGFDALDRSLAATSMDSLLATAGVDSAALEEFVDEIARAEKMVLVWSMGITQHKNGADTVRAIANLGLLREAIGRPGTGLMPIRGHSGVQGGAEMGAYASAFPGGLPIDATNARRFSQEWGFDVPDRPGLPTATMLEAAGRGEIDALWCSGGNFLETMPEPARIERALARIPLRVHCDIVVTSQMLVDPAPAAGADATVWLLPVRTRYEQKDGGTETSTERRVIYSPHVPGHDVGDARSEWELLLDLARAVDPARYSRVHFESGAAIRADIARAVPAYRGIETLSKQGDQFQWGGARLCTDREFPTADGKAHFAVVTADAPSESCADATPRFVIATRRGKQFNSMVQADRDPLTGAMRDHVFISPRDAARLGLSTDDPIVLRSSTGEYRGRAFVAEVTDGTLQGHWPEVNGLIRSGVVDEDGGVPDYNAVVTVERAAP